MKLIATYARVSTSTQEDQQTIKTQTSALQEFAEKNGYKIVQEYEDDGWSGDTLIRPSLDQLRVDASKKVWEAVLVYDPDRIARRYSYQELVMDELREAGIEIIFITTPAPKNNEDKILYGVKGLFAEYERAKIAERFRLGKLRKVKEGHILTTEPLYGYKYIRKNDKTHGYYEINDEEAKVVKLIFSLVANEKLTLRAIVRRLQDLKIKPRKSKRGVWSTSTLSTMLRHKGYVGEAHWGSSYAVVPENPLKDQKYKKQKKTSRRNRPEEEWYKIPIPAIIDQRFFERVQKQLDDNFAQSKRNRKNEFLLANKTWCTCGSRRCGCGPKGGRYLYYRCNDRIKQFPLPTQCDEGGFSAKVADEKVWQKLSSLMTSPNLLLSQAEKWHKSRQDKPAFSVGNIKDLGREMEKLKNEEERYSKAYGIGALDITQLIEYTRPLKERMKVIDQEIVKIKQDNSQIMNLGVPNREEVEEFAYRASQMLKSLSFELKREIVLSIVDKVVGNQKELKVTGFIPVSLESNVLFCTKYRHCWVAERGEVHALQRADQERRAGGELSLLHY